jgi:hypothetical protein
MRTPGEAHATLDRASGAPATDLMTKRQLTRLATLGEDHRVVGVRKGIPIVRRADGRVFRMQPNGHLVQTSSVQDAQSYLELERC